MTNTGAQLSTVPDEAAAEAPAVPFKPPRRLDIRKASKFDFVPSSPNSARAKRSPKSNSYASRYENRTNSPGSLMSPKSDAAALVGASARDETPEAAQWRMRLEPRVVVLVDGVLAALRKAGASAGTSAKEPEETESDNSIAGGVAEATQLARRCFLLLLESQVVDLHHHARLFVLLCGNVHARLKRAAGGLLTAAATHEGFRKQAVITASALAAYQSYRHHRRRAVDEQLADLDYEIAKLQAVIESAAAQQKALGISEMKNLLDLCQHKRRLVLSIVHDGVARADGEELLGVQAKLVNYVDSCASAIDGYSSPQPFPAAATEPEPEAAHSAETQATPAEAQTEQNASGSVEPGDALVEAEVAQESRRLRLEMELRKLDEARQAVMARLSAIDSLDKDETQETGPGAEMLSHLMDPSASGSPSSGDLSPSHPSEVRIAAAVSDAVKETLREMLRWEVLQIDESLCRATMQYLKFSQRYLQRRSRASEMLIRRLAMCSARYETLIESAQKSLNPSTPIDHESEISPPTPRTTSASPETREGDSGLLDPTGQSEIFGLPVSKEEALKECKKQKRMVSETSRQLKKILTEWDELFIVVTDCGQDLQYLPTDYGPRCAAEEFQRKMLREILVLIQTIRKALATHANRDRPRMPEPKDERSQPALRFNPGAAEFNPGMPADGYGYHMNAMMMMMDPRMMMMHHGVPLHAQPGYFPGMANMVMVPSQLDSAVGDNSGGSTKGYRSSDADSVNSDSSDWSTSQSTSTSASEHSDHNAGGRLSAGARTAQMLNQQADAHALKEYPAGRRQRARSNPDMSFSHLEAIENDDDFHNAAVSVDLDEPGRDEGAIEKATSPAAVSSAVPSESGGSSSPAADDAKSKGAALLSVLTDSNAGAERGQESPGAGSVSSTSSAGSLGSRSKQHRRAATMDERELRGQVAAAADLPLQKLS